MNEKETGRVEAFSDGVFAVAITLLALDIHVPRLDTLPPGGLGPALLALWPTLLAYVTSFATILITWINHDRLFEQIRRKDHGLLVYNGLLLMVITLFPFPTALLAEYLPHPGAEREDRRRRLLRLLRRDGGFASISCSGVMPPAA